MRRDDVSSESVRPETGLYNAKHAEKRNERKANGLIYLNSLRPLHFMAIFALDFFSVSGQALVSISPV
ncbi:MAG: hypothetical protein KZQ95_13600 [Candidatus Thiodiazotropha sp. (ex Epidulcina cf. delphinae)]|nr:hypothetical protein [Candidatus Thiodiazotropha sp. (ex Epidulcina cf. delphinae)]